MKKCPHKKIGKKNESEEITYLPFPPESTND